MKKLIKTAQTYFEKKGMVKIPSMFDGWIEYEKETKYGMFRVRIDDDLGSGVFSVFGRFSDVEKMPKIETVNKYSGKYNFHAFLKNCGDLGNDLGKYYDFIFEL